MSSSRIVGLRDISRRMCWVTSSDFSGFHLKGNDKCCSTKGKCTSAQCYTDSQTGWSWLLVPLVVWDWFSCLPSRMTKQDQVVCPFCRKSTELQKRNKAQRRSTKSFWRLKRNRRKIPDALIHKTQPILAASSKLESLAVCDYLIIKSYVAGHMEAGGQD